MRSLDLQHSPSAINDSGQAEVNYLSSVQQKGFIRREDDSYSMREMPPIEFQYQVLDWNTEVKDVTADSLVHSPNGLSDGYRWVEPVWRRHFRHFE